MESIIVKEKREEPEWTDEDELLWLAEDDHYEEWVLDNE